MQRFLIPALAAAVLAGGALLAPAPASAQNYNGNQSYGQNQNSYNRNNGNNGATAWGDPWLNENDFDYNRRHWLPGPGDTQQGNNNENWNRDQNRYSRNQNNWDERRGSYNQNNGNWNRNYDNRYGNRSYDDYQSGLGRTYRPDNRYDNDDDE